MRINYTNHENEERGICGFLAVSFLDFDNITENTFFIT
jgi:hypothetical protein